MISVQDESPKLVLNSGQASALLELVVGDKLGSGAFRDVYEYLPDVENWVIKIAKNLRGAEHNAKELMYFREHGNMYSPYRDYFAEVKKCDDAHWILLQRRIQQPLAKFTKVVLELPLTGDLHRGNVGYIDGHAVIYDLGYANLADKIRVCQVEFPYGDEVPGEMVDGSEIPEDVLKERFEALRVNIDKMVAESKTDAEIRAKLPRANPRLIDLARKQFEYRKMCPKDKGDVTRAKKKKKK